MRRLCVVVSLIFWGPVGPSPGLAGDDPAPAARAATVRRHGLDTSSAPATRVTATPPDVLKMFADAGMAGVKPHALGGREPAQLRAAFEALPPLHRRILGERLHSLSFLDAMPNTALTSRMNPDEPAPLFHITIRAGIFREDVSRWATLKERTCFDAAGSPLEVSIDAGGMDSINYVLLHEATHIVDAALGLTPGTLAADGPRDPAAPTEFTRGVWTAITLPEPRYRDPLLQATVFHDGGAVLPIARAPDLYAALRRTPFASLYASHASSDDLAEYVAIYHWTQVLRQPYRITLRSAGPVVFEYEPMKSERVRERFGQMARFYE